MTLLSDRCADVLAVQAEEGIQLSTGYFVDFERMTQARVDNPNLTRKVRRQRQQG